ncbi:MAG TPA: PPC domain-containing protein, partial [Planctomycetaceae bacterium]|nr:PPC domain-containing protein [Planctomycetaceae bacterium]
MAVYSTLNFSFRSFVLSTLTALILAISLASVARSQDPVIDRIDATDLRPGQAASVVVSGKQLVGAMGLWTAVGVLRPKEGQDLTKDQPVVFEGNIAADAIPGIYPTRMVTNHGCSEAAFVVIDDLPSIAVTPESEDHKTGQLLTLPCCINGQLNPVRSRFFRVTLTAGQAVSIEILARRLGSDLDPVLIVSGPDGREVAYRDDMPGAEGDTQLQFTAATDGEYRIEVRDVRYSGGVRHFFHLRLGKFSLVSTTSPRVAQAGQNVSLIGTTGEVVSEASPQSALEAFGSLIPVTFRTADADASSMTDVLLTGTATQPETEPNDDRPTATTVAPETQMLTGTLQKEGDIDWFKFTVTEATPLLVTARTREVGSPTDILLQLYNADGGKLAENDDAGPRDAELSFQLPEAGDFFLKVSEIAGRGGVEWTYALDVYRNRPALRVTAPADRINVFRGGSTAIPLTVRRIQYDGPLKVEAVGLPAAIQMAPFWLGAKQSTAPVVLTAADPAATNSDADWGPVSFRITAPDGSMILPAELQLVPPPPK